MVSLEPRVLSSKASEIRISIAGRIDDRGYQMCRVIARSLVEANTHVSVELVPLMETQFEEFVRVTAKVCSPFLHRLQLASRCTGAPHLRARYTALMAGFLFFVGSGWAR